LGRSNEKNNQGQEKKKTKKRTRVGKRNEAGVIHWKSLGMQQPQNHTGEGKWGGGGKKRGKVPNLGQGGGKMQWGVGVRS